MLTTTRPRTTGDTRRIAVSTTELRQLGTTTPDPDTARLLLATRVSKRLLLLRTFLDAVPRPGESADHWALLEAAERAAPEAVREVLHHPAVGSWAEETLRRLRASRPDAPPDLGYFGAMAAAAALRAGLDFSVRLRSGGRLLALPSLGALRRERPGVLTVTAESWRQPPADCQALPLHRLAGTTVTLDDLDPYRAPRPFGRVRPARRLTAQGRAQWDRRFTGAMALLDRVDPARAEEIRTLLSCVVPLARTSRSAGATAPATPGSVLLRPRARLDLAAALVHEVAHGKLAALSDLVRLHTAGPEPHYRVPWRPDRRPFEGLLHGAYAHAALAGWWRRAAHAGVDGASARHAHYGRQVTAVLPVLVGSRHLTPEGHEFVGALADHGARIRSRNTEEGRQ
ncbi:aKG-HExxH-type peptide beta-hydroxylase [Streptomyces justiciae]|uniref:HEXXH motif-containing putative peptide modification protein n=1 Tax=Streptomyces justiciae TaxID=2780140 RepID=A0ABU3LY46_9ACTN|nr:HEXXH motif-containing putative peptide modification protein [Streptomyces justiciae]MDT7844164.1 HEXXH motif-containing putative peptide modification protein [Streptomyces justiciae]